MGFMLTLYYHLDAIAPLSIWFTILDTLSHRSLNAAKTIYYQLNPQITPDSRVHGANMGPIWGRQDPGGPHVGPMKFAIWDDYEF